MDGKTEAETRIRVNQCQSLIFLTLILISAFLTLQSPNFKKIMATSECVFIYNFMNPVLYECYKMHRKCEISKRMRFKNISCNNFFPWLPSSPRVDAPTQRPVLWLGHSPTKEEAKRDIWRTVGIRCGAFKLECSFAAF